MTEIALEQYNRLVEAIYEAGVDHDKWQDFMLDLGGVLDGVYLSMHGHDLKSDYNTGVLYTLFDDTYMRSFQEHYAPSNPWLRNMQTMPVGRAMAAEQLCPRENLTRTEFYNDWLRPQEDVGSGAAMVLFRDDDRMLAVCGNTRLRDSEEVQTKLISVLDLLAPHLQRAFNIQRSLEGYRLNNSCYLEALDAMGNAVFLIDRKCRTAHLNSAAENLVRNGDELTVAHDGTLRCSDREAGQRVSAALESIGRGEFVGLPGPIIARAADARVLCLAIVPFLPDHDNTGILRDFVGDGLPVAMLTVTDPSRPDAKAASLLETLYDLTGAEQRLAEALKAGQSTSDYAQSQGLSVHTVRNQLRSLMEKTDTHRQAELVALLNRVT